MKWESILPYASLFAFAITALGWLIVHWLTRRRDYANKLRDIRLQYLIEAYRRLCDASDRQLTPANEHAHGLESAIADIQLFGTDAQVEKLKIFLENYAADGSAALDDVINDLRNELRNELDLSRLPGNVQFMRFRRSRR